MKRSSCWPPVLPCPFFGSLWKSSAVFGVNVRACMCCTRSASVYGSTDFYAVHNVLNTKSRTADLYCTFSMMHLLQNAQSVHRETYLSLTLAPKYLRLRASVHTCFLLLQLDGPPNQSETVSRESSNAYSAGTVGSIGGSGRRTERSLSPSFPAGVSTVEVASAIESQRRRSRWVRWKAWG